MFIRNEIKNDVSPIWIVEILLGYLIVVHACLIYENKRRQKMNWKQFGQIQFNVRRRKMGRNKNFVRGTNII